MGLPHVLIIASPNQTTQGAHFSDVPQPSLLSLLRRGLCVSCSRSGQTILLGKPLKVPSGTT